MVQCFSTIKISGVNLAWLTQKTEDLKSNKGNFTFPTYRVNATELYSNKKWLCFPPISKSTFSFQAYSPF